MLDEYVEFAIENARHDVAHHRSVLTNATVIDSHGEMVIVGATNLQTERDKDGWFALIKRHVAERHAQAVVITAGVKRAIYSEEGGRTFKQLREAGIELSIDDGVKLGLCEKVDAIMVGLYTPLQTAVYTQDYEYLKGKVVFGKRIKLDTNAGDSLTGRFADFFDPMSGAVPS